MLVPVYNIIVTLSSRTIIHRTAAKHEIRILKKAHGPDTVQVDGDKIVRSINVDPVAEFSRLERLYGRTISDTGEVGDSYAVKVYDDIDGLTDELKRNEIPNGQGPKEEFSIDTIGQGFDSKPIIDNPNLGLPQQQQHAPFQMPVNHGGFGNATLQNSGFGQNIMGNDSVQAPTL